MRQKTNLHERPHSPLQANTCHTLLFSALFRGGTLSTLPLKHISVRDTSTNPTTIGILSHASICQHTSLGLIPHSLGRKYNYMKDLLTKINQLACAECNGLSSSVSSTFQKKQGHYLFLCEVQTLSTLCQGSGTVLQEHQPFFLDLLSSLLHQIHIDPLLSSPSLPSNQFLTSSPITPLQTTQ